MQKKIIVVSAVNLNVGGTLTILKDCLSYLSSLANQEEYRVVAIVYKKELADFPNIEYIETQWPKKRWINRLWYEYVSMRKVSKEIGTVHLWFSLHDTTPNVYASRRAVYCHNPFPFYRWKWRELLFAPKIVLFALFSKLIYQKNIHLNDYVVVQQQWIKDAFKDMFSLADDKIVVALPEKKQDEFNIVAKEQNGSFQFIYAASPNSHKNFECLTQAVSILEDRGVKGFNVNITINGSENSYAKWLKKHWGDLDTLSFIGFQDRTCLFNHYQQSDCLVFPSKVETWGLPITEYSAFDRPMLLADLPYAHETAAGNHKVAFFDPDKPHELATLMEKLIMKEDSFLQTVAEVQLEPPFTKNWESMFAILLKG